MIVRGLHGQISRAEQRYEVIIVVHLPYLKLVLGFDRCFRTTVMSHLGSLDLAGVWATAVIPRITSPIMSVESLG